MKTVVRATMNKLMESTEAPAMAGEGPFDWVGKGTTVGLVVLENSAFCPVLRDLYWNPGVPEVTAKGVFKVWKDLVATMAVMADPSQLKLLTETVADPL